MVDEAMKAATLLGKDGIEATVVDLRAIRPPDTELVEKAAARCARVLVCENGRRAGGIGEMIASHLAEVNPVRMGYVNVGERFGEVGNLACLKEAFGFTGEKIAMRAKKLCM